MSFCALLLLACFFGLLLLFMSLWVLLLHGMPFCTLLLLVMSLYAAVTWLLVMSFSALLLFLSLYADVDSVMRPVVNAAVSRELWQSRTMLNECDIHHWSPRTPTILSWFQQTKQIKPSSVQRQEVVTKYHHARVYTSNCHMWRSLQTLLYRGVYWQLSVLCGSYAVDDRESGIEKSRGTEIRIKTPKQGETTPHNGRLLLGQRRRRWSNNKPTLGRCFAA